MILPFIFAVLSPLFLGLGNIFDKFVVEHKIKDIKAYGIFVGFSIFIVNALLAIFLNWSNFEWQNYIIFAITGIFNGINTWLFYNAISKEDISNVIGMIYLYPVLVAILSFLFLSERIPFVGYVGIAITLLGTILLTTKLSSLKKSTLLNMLTIAAITGVNEFLIKIGTSNAPPLNGLVVNGIFASVVLISGLFFKSIRKSVKDSLKVSYLALIVEPIYFAGTAFLFLAMSNLPATIVSTIAAIQPLFVVLMEIIVGKFFKITNGTKLKDKLISISLIVLGVVLIYVNGI